jgi:DNA-binding XRE family transcriptional regulator
MPETQHFQTRELAHLAKKFRTRAGKTRASASRELGVSQTSIFNAEETPQQGLVKLRIKMIEKYSEFKVKGPIFLLVSAKTKKAA